MGMVLGPALTQKPSGHSAAGTWSGLVLAVKVVTHIAPSRLPLPSRLAAGTP
jgi:hypothetical protein